MPDKVEELANSLPRRGPSLLSRFLVVSLPVLAVLGYFIFDASRFFEVGLVWRLAAGVFLIYAALLYLVWRISRSARRQEDLINLYAKNLEAKVRQRTRELEESTAREIEAAKEVARLKDEFIFIAAHELRTPVSVLEWVLDTMKRQNLFSALAPDTARLLEIVKSSSDKLAALINDLLNVARLESYKITLEKKPVNLGEILQASVNGLIPMAQQKNISVEFRAEEFDSLPKVLGDELKLQEVFNNLISNAIKFNHPGGKVMITAINEFPPLDGEDGLSAGRQDPPSGQAGEGVSHVPPPLIPPRKGEGESQFIAIRIKDTGLGIKKEHFPRLFTKFFRAYEDIEGTGLGLWIVKEIMRRLGGDVMVESEEGRGSTFTVKIPIAKV